MMIVREVVMEDLDQLWDLIGNASAGMTSLNIDREQLADRVERSTFAFRRTTERAEGAPYVFVMEDTAQGRLVGTSCIFSKTGGFEPFYAYRIDTEMSYCERLKQSSEIQSLHLLKIHNGPTEIGSLFLLPELRGMGCGKLLSLSRFAFMAAHPKRFANKTIAEMRGYMNEQGRSAFWEAIGAHFFNIDFPDADSLSMIDKQFIEDLMPRHPIYLHLLPKNAREVIGRVHEQTKPALAMLEAQGFRRNGLIDIFDAGPSVECETNQIRAINETRFVSAVTAPSDQSQRPTNIERAIISSVGSPFRSIQSNIAILGNEIIVSQELLDCLQVEANQKVCVTA
jgi:arginine N-succinyltransferase